MWQNSPNLGETGAGEEPSGGSAAGTNFCRDLWASHPNLPSAERQLRDLSSERGKATTLGHALNYLKGKEGRGKGAEVAGQAAPGPRCAVRRLLLPPAPREPQPRVRLRPRQRKTHGKSRGMLPAGSREREKPCPQPRPSARTSSRRCPVSRGARPCPACPGEARAAAVTWEYRIWYKL